MVESRQLSYMRTPKSISPTHSSPFQIELGFASIGFGVVGLIAPWKSLHMRFAAVAPVACFLWGAAGVHIRSMISDGNFDSGNAGVIFWTDILIPLAGLILIWLQRRYEKEGRSAAPYPNPQRILNLGIPQADP